MSATEEATESDADRIVAKVVVDVDVPHLDYPFEYVVPEKLQNKVFVGCQVSVRFGGRRVNGWVTDVSEHSDSGRELAPLQRVVGPFPLVSEGLLQSAKYLARRYAASLSQVLSFAVPTRRASEEKTVAALKRAEAKKVAAKVGEEPSESPPPTPRALPRRVVATLYPGQMAVYLLKAAMEQVESGRSVVIVLPTSAQVDLLARYIRQESPQVRLGTAMTSSSPQERYRVHLEAAAGLFDVLVGTRSAVWSTMPNLGAIIIWDDGDDRLRERRAPRFDALDIGVARSLIEGVDLLSCAYARSVKSQMLVHSGWAADGSPPREPNLSLIPKVRIFDWFSAQKEGRGGTMRLPDAAYSLIRQGLVSGPVLIQVSAAGYETPIPCRLCGQPAENPGEGCEDSSHDYATRLRIGSDRIREDLARAFPNLPVRVSSSTGGMLRSVEQRPQIIVATTGSEPYVTGGYAATVITGAEGLAYLDELWAPLEAARRWFNALALGAPGSPAMLIGSFDEVTSQSVVQWRPAELAEAVLSERIELGFPPSRWVVSISGDSDGVEEASVAIGELATSVASEGMAAKNTNTESPEQVFPQIYVLAEGTGEGNERGHLIVSSCPKTIFPLMDALKHVQVERSSKRESLLEFEVNPPSIAPKLGA